MYEFFDTHKGHDHPATLEVIITYRGDEAKRLAADKDAQHEAQGDLFYEYSRCYPDIKMTEPSYSYVDDDGSVVVGAYFEIPKLWEKISGNNRYRACFYNQAIKDYFDNAEESSKKNGDGALTWAHPVSIEKEVIIELPNSRNPYRITPESDDVKNPHFTLHYARSIEDSILEYAYRFDTHSATVPAADADAFRADAKKARTLTSACDVRYDAPYTLGTIVGLFVTGLPFLLMFIGAYAGVRYFRPSKERVALSIRDFTHRFTIDAPVHVVWNVLMRFDTVPHITRTVLVQENGEEIPWRPEYARENAIIKHYGTMYMLQKITGISRIVALEEGVRIAFEIPLQQPIVGYEHYHSSGREETTLEANGHGGTVVTFTVQSQVEFPVSLRITGKKLHRILRRVYTRYGKALARAAKKERARD